MNAATTPVRAAGALGVAWGVALLARPEPLWRAVTGSGPDEIDVLAARALGVRQLVQGAAQAAAPTHLRGLFVTVDLLHAATMLPLAVRPGRRRRAAALSTAVALASAATTVAAGRAGRGGHR
ncbi:hypothetical protein [Nostocoides sp. Soil756]|uniref:hypothetical protein n=1 Tax=Nostocoides sp. Soil756 TaxID=1736399 RepID=UPI00070022D5|nr:hypothetical protein [Tetrasphaera sp. Soil756]KRE63724.1 hypothetical protein ASG78_02290 [Tetrasphaera sp. Soil756]